MPEKKYSKYILPAPIMMVPPEDGANSDGYRYPSVFAHKGELNTGHTLGFHYMTEPYQDVYPHTHEGSEILCFVGGNPENINDFDAEIEIVLGEEGDAALIGVVTLKNLGLVINPFKRTLQPMLLMMA